MSEDEKKKKKIKSLLKSYESVSVVGVLAHFGSEHCVWSFFSDFGTFVPKYILPKYILVNV